MFAIRRDGRLSVCALRPADSVAKSACPWDTSGTGSIAVAFAPTWSSDRPTFFRSAARGLRVPAALTPETTKHEPRKRRANKRPRVGCCEELGSAALASNMVSKQDVVCH